MASNCTCARTGAAKQACWTPLSGRGANCLARVASVRRECVGRELLGMSAAPADRRRADLDHSRLTLSRTHDYAPGGSMDRITLDTTLDRRLLPPVGGQRFLRLT